MNNWTGQRTEEMYSLFNHDGQLLLAQLTVKTNM